MLRRFASFFMLATASIHAAVGDAWVTRDATPTSATLHSIAWTGSAFIAAGKHGAVFSSLDGSAWTAGTTGTQSHLHAITSSGSLSVVAGDDGMILSSTNGTTWSAQLGPTHADWRAAVWTGSKFILVGDGGAVATSSDGSVWAFHFIGAMSDLRSIAATGSLIVAGGNNGFIAVSNDGITWTSVTSGTTASIRSLVHNGTLWAAATDTGVVLTSSNANNWTGVSTGVGVALTNIVWTGTQFITTGVDGACATSANGSAWSVQTTGTNGELLASAFANNTIVIVGDRGIVTTSTNGTAWTVQSSGVRDDIQDLVNTGSQWVATGYSGSIKGSPAGVGWTASPSNVTSNMHGIAWNGSRLVAVGDAGAVIRSTDGSTWTTATAITTRSLQSVAASPTQFVAVGEAGIMLASSDGTSWSTVSSITSATWRGITWTGTQFVAVGDSGSIGTSTTGTSWTVRTSGVAIALESVVSSGSLLVAVGASGTVLTSTSGATWSKITLPIADLAFAHFQSVKWDGLEFIAVGEHGSPIDPTAWVMTSYDGNIWLQRPIEAAPPLASVAISNGEIFAVGLAGSILQNSASGLPELAFQIDQSSFAESAGTVAVVLTLSTASSVPIKVNFVTTGSTALIGTTGDVIVPAPPFTFPPGQTTASLNLTLREDTIDESDETVVLTLRPSTGATLGLPRIHTLTLTDNDTAPSITMQPTNEVVAAGTALTMKSSVVGDAPLTFQWTQNNVNISGATSSSYLIPSALLTHAGTYRLKATNKSGTITSDPAELVVVDARSKLITLVYKTSGTFTVGTGGNNLTYQWQHDGSNLLDDVSAARRISGTTTKTLVIKNLAITDSGVYVCHVTSPVGSIDGGQNELTVTIPPVVNPPTFPTLMLSQLLSYQVTAQNTPTHFTITGLPSGLTYNSATGLITGRPLIASGAQPFTITITASNAAGPSTPPTTAPLSVQALGAGISGTYFGLINREPNLNANLGGRIQIIVSKTGVATGSLMLGKASYTFIKAIDTSTTANPTLSIAIKRIGKSDLKINGNLDPNIGLITGSTQDVTGTANFQAQLAKPPPFTGFPARYTIAIKLTNNNDAGVESIPQGYGYIVFNLGRTGVASGSGRLADGTTFTLSTSLRNTNALALYNVFYTAPGSLHGWLNVAPSTPALITSNTFTWFKPSQLSGRSYKAGFGPLDLTAFGSTYTAPAAGTIALGLAATADNVPNTVLNFAEGGAPDPPNRLNIQFRVTAPNLRDPQTPATNPGKVTVSINHLTSGVTGSFSLSDLDITVVPNKTVIRTSTYYSLIVRDPSDGILKAYGHFQLPKLPDNAVLPATTPTTSPILSGKVTLEHVP